MMSQRAAASFDVSSWDVAPYQEPDDGPGLARGRITKTFRGDLEGSSDGYGLFCGMERPADGAGYVVSERFEGLLCGRTGSFVMQHGGLMGEGAPPRTFGNIVPGSGTDELAGLRGTVEIRQGPDGDHAIMLEFDIMTA